MNSTALRPAIWLTNFILLGLVTSLVMLLSLYTYYGYSINSVIQLEFLNIDVASGTEKWLINTKVLLLALGLGLSLFIFWNVRQVLKAIKVSGPFEQGIVSKLKVIFSSTAVLLLFEPLTTFLVGIYQRNAKITLSTNTLIIVFLICIIYLLIEIFKYGVAIKDEQRMTI